MVGGNNLFAYAINSPIGNIDPNGLIPLWLSRLLTPVARYLHLLPPATKVAQDYLDEGPGVASAIKEVRWWNTKGKEELLKELKTVIDLHSNFYTEKFDECLMNCRRNKQLIANEDPCNNESKDCDHCLKQFSKDWDEMVSPYIRKYDEVKNSIYIIGLNLSL